MNRKAMNKASNTRRNDPGRRDRIIRAAIQVIASSGVSGVTHRKVAAVAQVPLGSMTYYFTGIDDLIYEAFNLFAQRMADAFDERMACAQSPDEAIEIIAETILDEHAHDDNVVTCELYTIAARESQYRQITEHWMSRSKTTLQRYFHPATTPLIDAFIEGLTLHLNLGRSTIAADTIRQTIKQLTLVHSTALADFPHSPEA